MADQSSLVLIADDEPGVLSVYKAKLERSGFRVIAARNGEEALKLAVAEHPDLVLMDMKMPVMDGVTAQAKLRDMPETKNIKVAFLTAFSDPLHIGITKETVGEIGAIDVIRKGISLDEFVLKVRSYLGLTG